MSDAPSKVKKSDADWQNELTDEEYYVTRKHGTERPFSHPYNNDKTKGQYTCTCCGEALFHSDAKFDSGTGWPSFFQPINSDAVDEHEDRSLYMKRVEVRCSNCDAHLGHVFPDGPQPTGQRFCLNGVALKLKPDD